MARVYYRTWGSAAPQDGYVLVTDGDNDVVGKVVAKIMRDSRLVCCAGPRSDGTRLERGEPVEHHYQITLGKPCPGGGWTPEGEVWFSIPV
jgi:hypothetical protein